MTRSPENSLSCDVQRIPKSLTPKKGHRLFFRKDIKLTDSQ